MLSILIPIFNVKVVKLIDVLIEQCKKAKINFEIVCLDDGSETKYRLTNREINARFCVNYVELSENIGRARIRNRLCMLARYDWLLFLDCDVRIPGKKFIKSYLKNLSEQGAYIGGITYTDQKPSDNKKLLHWSYGKARESLSAKKRQKYPILYFHTGNFLISRNHMINTPFREELLTYGYEDLAMGQEFYDKGGLIFHLDNPVIHRGLKKFDDFLGDQHRAIDNLASLYVRDVIRDTRLIRAYKWLSYCRLIVPLIYWIKKNEVELVMALKERPDRLFRLDFLKLYYFDKALKNLNIKGKQAS